MAVPIVFGNVAPVALLGNSPEAEGLIEDQLRRLRAGPEARDLVADDVRSRLIATLVRYKRLAEKPALEATVGDLQRFFYLRPLAEPVDAPTRGRLLRAFRASGVSDISVFQHHLFVSIENPRHKLPIRGELFVGFKGHGKLYGPILVEDGRATYKNPGLAWMDYVRFSPYADLRGYHGPDAHARKDLDFRPG